jgi:hypothetical protein
MPEVEPLTTAFLPLSIWKSYGFGNVRGIGQAG